MLLRNLSQSTGLCNGTCLVVSKLGEKVIEAIIMTGSNIGDVVYIPRTSHLLYIVASFQSGFVMP